MSKFSTRKWGRKILATVVAGSLALTMPMISTLQPMYVLADGDGATTTTGTGVYDADEDTLTLAGYNFYTVDKVDLNKSKVPAASKWIRTNDGEINLATITKSKVVTFAKTLDLDATKTTNFLSVTVPSLKTVSKITYVAAPETGKTLIQVTVKEGKEAKTLDTEAALAAVEFRVNNETAWTAYDKVEERLDELGKTGASISVRVKGAGSEAALKDDGTFNDSVVRASAAKVFKLAKKAAGPNVAIDYDNHVATLKKGTEYGTATAAADPASYTTVPDAGLSLSLESGVYYGVRTAAKGNKQASNATTVYVPATTTLEAGENISVAVTTGGAILDIKTPATDTYQYLLLTEDAYGKVVETVEGSKCYKGSFATEKANKNSYKWSSLKGKSAEIKKTIKFAKNTTPTRLLVRKAGNKKTGVYSTSIVVFTLGDSAWDNGATSLGYGGTTAAGDSGTTTATPSATASFTGTTTVAARKDVADVVVTIVFENATLTGLTYSDFSVVAKDSEGYEVDGLAGTVLEDGFDITGNTVTLNVYIENSKPTSKTYEKLEITLPTSLKIEGNTVVATK
ncbi:MAG: hypothetical protein IIT46_16155 [Lachnospiraceae bacterium]|nr:hypothetical protein [Lachnospiraceae bacterium]